MERAQCRAVYQFTCASIHSNLQTELSEAIKQQRRNIPKKRKDSAVSVGSDPEFEPRPAKKKKQKLISTGTGKGQPEKLYCVCKTPYDETKYVAFKMF